jgi:hypothetical protein
MKKNDKEQMHFQEMLFCKKCKHSHEMGGIYIKPCVIHRDEDAIHLTHDRFDKSSCGVRYKNIHLTDSPDEVTCLECQVKVINNLLIVP